MEKPKAKPVLFRTVNIFQKIAHLKWRANKAYAIFEYHYLNKCPHHSTNLERS